MASKRLLSLKNPTLIFGVIFLILLAYLHFHEIPQKLARDISSENVTLTLEIDTETIQKISIRYSDSEIHIEKQGPEQWKIVKPIITSADPQEIRGFLSTLSGLRHEQIIEEANGDPTEFGLTYPVLEVALESPAGNESIRIGDDTPVGGFVFLSRKSDGRIVTVQKWVQGALSRTVFDLREKNIFSYNAEKIDGITLKFPEITLAFEKTPAGWEINLPFSDPGDPESFAKLLTAMQNLRANSFIEKGGDFDQTILTFKKPLVEITIREGERVHQARFYDSPDPEKIWVFRNKEDPIFGTARAVLDHLKPGVFHYQDKRLVFFDPRKVSKIDIKGGRESYALVRVEGKWQLAGFEGPIQVHLADRLLTQIEKLAAYEPAIQTSLNKESNSLEKPGLVLDLSDSDSQPIASIRIGKEWKGMLFATGRPALGEVMINKDFLDEIPRREELIVKEEEAPLDSPPEEPENIL